MTLGDNRAPSGELVRQPVKPARLEDVASVSLFDHHVLILVVIHPQSVDGDLGLVGEVFVLE